MIQINQHLKFDFVGDIKLLEETNKEMSDRQRQECLCTPPNMENKVTEPVVEVMQQ